MGQCLTALVLSASVALLFQISVRADEPKAIRVGIIGLDTSHAIAFTKILNDDKAEADVAGCRVVAAYPRGSADIEASVKRVPEYTKQMQDMGVEIVDSIEALLAKVDAVLLETNDGRPHLEQALPVLRARKPLFIDKPMAGSLADVIALFEAAKKYDTPLFSASSLRYSSGALEARAGKFGEVLGVDSYSPCALEHTHPDLFWYGIHGVEALYTAMGTGCKTVVRVHADEYDFAVGTWSDGRIATFRGTRKGPHGYGGTVFASNSVAPLGPFNGYRPLVVDIVAMFRSGKPPVAANETIEIHAFMEAADESKRQGGAAAAIDDVMQKATVLAEKRLELLDP